MKKIINRVLEYSKKTGVVFHDTKRRNLAPSLLVPDMRGFSPHLRQVNLDQKQKKDLWIIHDLLHILFYDFVTFHLGEKAWLDKIRFFENHLGSEAFAVLVLDYHVLSFEKRGGLAVDIKAAKWESFQKLNEDLPDFRSQEFCKLLLSLYLSGECEELLAPENRKDYDAWIGHELRYSEKQRYYVHTWWSDLNLQNHKPESFVLQNSEVHFAVWELLDLLVYGTDKEWKTWTSQVALKNLPENLFSGLPKFRNIPSTCDFRFTDIKAVGDLSHMVEMARTPTASNLFLFWQILSSSSKIRSTNAVKKLAKSSQTEFIDEKAWSEVQELCKDLTKKPAKANQLFLGNFFLP